MRITLMLILSVLLLSGPARASWEEDWEIDQAAGAALRFWRMPLARFRLRGPDTPLMRSGLPPYDQQPAGAQVVPPPPPVKRISRPARQEPPADSRQRPNARGQRR